MPMTAGTEVLIVGAGPVGLFLAADLLRHGVKARVVERRAQVASYSRAVAIQPRTLEAMAPSGLTARLVKRGLRAKRARVAVGDERIDTDLSEVDGPFPFVLCVSQSETERCFAGHLEAHGLSIERDTELVMLSEDAGSGVSVTLRSPAGLQELRADYVIGCDGAFSTVRKQLGVAFQGEELPMRFAIADVDLPLQGSRDEIWLFMSKSGLCALFPLPATDRHWRVVADLRPEDAADLTLDVVATLLRDRAGLSARPENPTTLMSWAVSERIAPTWRVGRVLLAGDAAHVYSPMGNQGMNTGLQDAHNLAWKLALVLRGRASPALLDSYEAERKPIAARVLWDTHQFTRAATARGAMSQLMRGGMLGLLAGFDVLQRSVVDRATELDVSYRASPIVKHEGRPTAALHAGDRVPDVTWGPQTSLARLQGNHHLLLVLDNGEGTAERHGALMQIVTLVRGRFEGAVDAYLVIRGDAKPDWVERGSQYLLDPRGAIHARLGIRTAAALVIRPDGVLGYAGTPPQPAPVIAHLSNVLG